MIAIKHLEVNKKTKLTIWRQVKKNPKFEELLEKQGRARKWRTPLDPHIWPSKSRTTSPNLHTAAMWGHGMQPRRPARGDEWLGEVARDDQGYPCWRHDMMMIMMIMKVDVFYSPSTLGNILLEGWLWH